MADLKKIINDMEVQKEIINALPVNTKKNKEIYIQKLEEIKKEYSELQDELLREIKAEYNKKINEYQIDEALKKKRIRLQEIKKIRTIIGEIKTPYEKMKLDRAVFNLKRFYRKNLESINNEIKNCIDLFKEVGIDLTAKDFNFTPYVNQYMKIFFQELKKDKFDSEIMKKEFERIYWSSPNIIVHIQLNIRHLYLKKEVYLERMYSGQSAMVKKRLKISTEEILDRYNELKKEYVEETKKQSRYIIDKFLDGYWNLKDFDEKSIKRSYSKFINLEKLRENREEIDKHLIKLLHNLNEYRDYLRFKYLFDEVKNMYLDKNQKDTYKSIKKQIENKEKLLVGAHKFVRKTQKDVILQELEGLYEQLDILEVEEKIQKILNDKSTLKEMSNVIDSFYKFLFTCIIKNNKDITEPEIKVLLEEFHEFAKSPYNTISESIIMLQDKDIPLMIKDRYNLFDIKISKEVLNENNIENLIVDLEKIENYYYIRKSGLDLKDIDILCKMKKIITDNK